MPMTANRRILPAMAITAISLAVVYAHTFARLVRHWSADDNFSHGFLIPFIALYLVWQKRSALQSAEVQSNGWGIAVIVCGMAMHIVGNIGAELFTMRLSFVVTLWGLLLYILGSKMVRIVAVPMIYLLFMIPIPAIIWNQIAFPLQLFAAGLTAKIVPLFGIPIYREGNILHLANTTLEVVDACSGLRSLTSLLALSAAFSFLSNLRPVSKWALFLSAIPVAVAVNILRLTITALMARHIGPEAAQGFMHEASGMIIYFLALVFLYLIFAALIRIENHLGYEDS